MYVCDLLNLNWDLYQSWEVDIENLSGIKYLQKTINTFYRAETGNLLNYHNHEVAH